MSQLTTNTALLEAILAVATALPGAGSGDTGGSSMQVATGTMTSCFEAVSGLGFKPQYVAIIANSNFTTSSASTYYVAAVVRTPNEKIEVLSRASSEYGAMNRTSLSVTNDGFSLSASLSCQTSGGTYFYVAIG